MGSSTSYYTMALALGFLSVVAWLAIKIVNQDEQVRKFRKSKRKKWRKLIKSRIKSNDDWYFPI